MIVVCVLVYFGLLFCCCALVGATRARRRAPAARRPLPVEQRASESITKAAGASERRFGAVRRSRAS